MWAIVVPRRLLTVPLSSPQTDSAARSSYNTDYTRTANNSDTSNNDCNANNTQITTNIV